MSPTKLMLMIIGVMIGLVAVMCFLIEQGKQETIESYNKYAASIGAKPLDPADAKVLTTDDIRDLLLQLKYKIQPSRRPEVYPMYIYTGS